MRRRLISRRGQREGRALDQARDEARDEMDMLIGVAAGELLQWAWLAGHLAEWLTDPAGPVVADHTQRYPLGPARDKHAWMLDHISERIGALLDGDRGQP